MFSTSDYYYANIRPNQSGFFWKKSATKKDLAMVAWETICKPKTFGGMGLKKSGAVNTAFLAKLE